MKSSGLTFKSIFELFILAVVASCSNSQIESVHHTSIEVDTTWKSLSIREKIGQVVCLNYTRDQIQEYKDGSIETFINDYPVGSFFLASWNLNAFISEDSLEFVYRKTVRNLSAASKIPLLFLEDFETGLGHVIKKYTPLTSEMGLGATNSTDLATNFGELIAAEARSIGINWLLHPVADLNLNPFNHLTNVRALGDDVNLSVKMLPAQIQGMQTQNVAATAKHFPGDGTDFINQHFNTSSMKLNVEVWKQQHGRVFKTLIDSGVMAIMAGHISFPAYQQDLLDNEYLPATLSKELMTDLLKKKLGFKGVVVSDALQMAGISGYYKNDLETQIACFKAGADVLLWPDLEFMDTLEARIVRNEICMERLNDAVSRVWNMKKNLGLFENNYQPIVPLSKSDFEKHDKIAYEISKKSITLLSDKHQELPLDTTSTKNILLVIISETDHTETFSVLKKALRNKGFETDIRQNLSFFTKGHELPEIAKNYDKIILTFYSNPGNPWGTLAINGDQALSMWSGNKLPFNKVMSVGFGDPYKNLIYMPRTWIRINCYNADEFSQKALVDLLVGDGDFLGVSPVVY